MNEKRLKIKFSIFDKEKGIWDKLKPENFKVGNIFTTFREFTNKKYDYYCEAFLNREIFDVILNGKKIGEAKLIGVFTEWSESLPLSFIKGDTYHDWDRSNFEDLLEKLYGNFAIFGIILEFEILEVEQEVQIKGLWKQNKEEP